MICFLFLLFLISQPFTPVTEPPHPPPPKPVTATPWVPQARLATRPQASAPARTASPASPATAAPRATSRAAHLWRPASVSDSHTHTHTHTHTVTTPSSAWWIYQLVSKLRQNNCTFPYIQFSTSCYDSAVFMVWLGLSHRNHSDNVRKMPCLFFCFRWSVYKHGWKSDTS